MTGPFNAGKTTLVRSVAGASGLYTERSVYAASDKLHGSTTVAMDYGRLKIGDAHVHLFGTPGQERFDFMWDILAAGLAGYVVVVDGSDPSSFAEAGRINQHFATLTDAPSVIAVNKDASPAVAAELSTVPGFTSSVVVAVDARDPQSVRMVLGRLLEQVDQSGAAHTAQSRADNVSRARHG